MDGFSPIVGQQQAVELLQQAITKNRIAPAYLFVGASGVGRSLAAKCFTERLLCLKLAPEQQLQIQHRLLTRNHPDLFWVEPTYQHQGQFFSAKEAETAGLKRKVPPQIRIEQVRGITQFLSCPPLESSRAVVVIEEAQTMTEAAANALLKTLEEPRKATLILIAPSTDSLLPTLVSRCQRIPFYRLSPEDMTKILQNNGYGEILGDHELLAIAQGSPGNAIAALAQLQSLPETLRQSLIKLPKNSIEALQLAKIIDQDLDTQAQLWLLDYLQCVYWQKWQKKSILTSLDKACKYLANYVQPRLAWECTLLEILSVKLDLDSQKS